MTHGDQVPTQQDGENSSGIKDSLTVRGVVSWDLIDINNNEIIESQTCYNLITNSFRTIFQSWFTISLTNWDAGSATDIPTHIALGDGTTTPAVSDTALESEQLRKEITSKSATGSFGARMVVALASTEGNFGIKELGLLNAATDGDMYSHVAVNIAKTTNETLNIQWSLEIA